MDSAHFKFQHGQRNRQNDKRDGETQALAVGMKPFLKEGKKQSHQETQRNGQHHFQQRLGKDGNQTEFSMHHGFCDAEGHGEYHEAYRIVQCNNGKKDIRQRAAGLILADHHKRCGGRRCGCNGARA